MYSYYIVMFMFTSMILLSGFHITDIPTMILAITASQISQKAIYLAIDLAIDLAKNERY